MDPWLGFRLVHFLGIGVFAAGLGGAVLARAQARRLFSAHWVATAGLIVTWIGGFGLTKLTGASFRDPWIATALFASFLALHEAVAAAQRSRVFPFNVALTVGAFAAATGSMVVRVQGTPYIVAVAVVPLMLAALAWVASTRAGADAHDVDPQVVGPATQRWFVWVARAEGVSLLALMGLFMPMKYGAGIELDGGQGWFGWVHGILVFVYVQALWSAFRMLQWSLPRAAAGFVASLVPFGTFVFERMVFRASAQS